MAFHSILIVIQANKISGGKKKEVLLAIIGYNN